MREKLHPLLFGAMTAAVVIGFFPKSSAQGTAQHMSLTSTAFKQNENIPDQFTCKGANISPDLWWAGVPAGTQSLLLIVEDTATTPFTHWLVYNMVPDKRNLPAHESKDDINGLLQGKNDASQIGYTGPCPPKDSGSHQYYFTIYALDSKLNLPEGADKSAVINAMTGHVLAQGSLRGRYEVK